VLDELLERTVIHRPLTNFAIEVDLILEHILQGLRVSMLQGSQCLVESRAYGGLQVGNAIELAAFLLVFPGGFVGHEEVVLVRVGQLLVDQVGLQPFGLVVGTQSSFVSLELVVDTFEEQYAKDVFLELRRIHVATQDVAGFE